MANAFQRKLEGAPGSTTVLARCGFRICLVDGSCTTFFVSFYPFRFRLCVVDLMPKCFHGRKWSITIVGDGISDNISDFLVCNRGTRDLPPQHFQLPTAIGDVELWGPPELSDTEQSKDDGGSASDSSSGSVRNFQQSGDKRRRTAGAVDVSGGVGDVSPTIRRKQSKGKGKLLHELVTQLVIILNGYGPTSISFFIHLFLLFSSIQEFVKLKISSNSNGISTAIFGRH